jgi:7,8-dihydroneopterin aldolase/epimerase/oxygenase
MVTASIPWTIEVRALATALRAGAGWRRQAVTVDITIQALAPARPQTIEDCIDYQPICEHVLGAWSETASAAQPEAALRDLVAFILDHDARIGHVDAGLATGGVALRVAQARPLRQARRVA